jgi:dolichol-phosphate mannosyltransferase
LSYIIIPKDAGDFSLIDRKVVEHLIALPEKEQFLRGLRAWLGFKQIGVDYVRPERAYGVTTNNIWKNIWWAKKGIFSFSYAPLEIMSYGGFGLTILSIFAIGIQTYMKLVHPDIPHGISSIIVLILFFGGVQLLAMSIIGEYLAKVLEESKNRPKFIRDSIILKGKKIERNSELNRLLRR